MPYSGHGVAAAKNYRDTTPATSQNPPARGSAARRAWPLAARSAGRLSPRSARFLRANSGIVVHR